MKLQSIYNDKIVFLSEFPATINIKSHTSESIGPYDLILYFNVIPKHYLYNILINEIYKIIYIKKYYDNINKFSNFYYLIDEILLKKYISLLKNKIDINGAMHLKYDFIDQYNNYYSVQAEVPLVNFRVPYLRIK